MSWQNLARSMTTSYQSGNMIECQLNEKNIAWHAYVNENEIVHTINKPLNYDWR